jgi:predicted nucleotidyltransferase
MQIYTIPNLMQNIDWLKSEYPMYVFHSPVLGFQMSAVSRERIVEHYKPSVKMAELTKSDSRDELEEKTVSVVQKLSKLSGTPLNRFGVTGSILLGIHRLEFSDINIVLYGREYAEIIKRTIKESFTRETSLKPMSNTLLRGKLQRWVEEHHLSFEEARWFALRKWNRGLFEDRFFSILPVKLPCEMDEKYGEKLYYSKGIVEGSAVITNITDSFFLPCTYEVNFLKPSNLKSVRNITSFDGFYSAIFESDDEIRFRGKLEEVKSSRSKEILQRVVIGSSEAGGTDYLKPTDLATIKS